MLETLTNTFLFIWDDAGLVSLLAHIAVAVLVAVLAYIILNRIAQLTLIAAFQWALLHPWLNQGLTIKGAELVPQAVMQQVTRSLVALFRVVLQVLVLGITLIILFSVVPDTRKPVLGLLAFMGHTLTKWFWLFVAFFPNLLSIGLICLLGWGALKIIHAITRAIGNHSLVIQGFHADWARPTFQLLRVFVVVSVITMSFPYLPVYDSPAFKAMGLFIGALISFGASGAIANLVAGVLLIYNRAYTIGDVITFNETFGTVVSKNLLTTRIRTPKMVDVVLPNSLLLTAPITNHSENAEAMGILLHTTVTIGYDVPWETVHGLLKEAAANTPFVLESPAPFVLQTKLDDLYVHYELNAATDKPGQMPRIYSDLHQHILDTFNAANVEIMSPQIHDVRRGISPYIPKT